MKKTILAIPALLTVLLLAACGGSSQQVRSDPPLNSAPVAPVLTAPVKQEVALPDSFSVWDQTVRNSGTASLILAKNGVAFGSMQGTISPSVATLRMQVNGIGIGTVIQTTYGNYVESQLKDGNGNVIGFMRAEYFNPQTCQAIPQMKGYNGKLFSVFTIRNAAGRVLATSEKVDFSAGTTSFVIKEYLGSTFSCSLLSQGGYLGRTLATIQKDPSAGSSRWIVNQNPYSNLVDDRFFIAMAGLKSLSDKNPFWN